MNRYLVISADRHAGLPGPAVPRLARPELPRAVRRSPRRAGARGRAGQGRASSTRSSPRSGTRRTRRACAAVGTRPAATRSSTPTASPARSSSPTPTRSPAARRPRSAPASAPAATRPGELLIAGARAHNRWLAELCADSPERRAGVAIVPILDDVDAAVAEIRRAHESGLRGGILIPPMWQPHAPYHDPRYDPVWAVCEELRDARARALRRRPTRRRTARTSASTSPRRASGRRGRCGSSSGPACSSGSPACGSASPSAARSGPPTCCGGWTSCYERDHGPGSSAEQLTAQPDDAPERVLRPQLLHRRVEHHPASSWPAATRSASATSVGQRLPAPRGHLAAHPGVPAPTRSGTSRSTRPRRSSGATRPRSTASTSTRSRRSSTASGRRPRSSARTDDPTAEVGRRQAGRPPVAHRHRDVADGHPAGVTTTTGPAPFDPLDPALRRVALRQYARLRDDDPVHWSELLSGWVVTRFDDVDAVLRDPSMSSDIHKATPNPMIELEIDRPGRARPGQRRRSSTSTTPTTRRVRKLMAEPFRVREVNRLGDADRRPRRPPPSTGSADEHGAGAVHLDLSPTSPTRCRSRSSPSGSASPRRPTRSSAYWTQLGGPQPRPDERPEERDEFFAALGEHVRVPRRAGRAEAAGAGRRPAVRTWCTPRTTAIGCRTRS